MAPLVILMPSLKWSSVFPVKSARHSAGLAARLALNFSSISSSSSSFRYSFGNDSSFVTEQAKGGVSREVWMTHIRICELLDELLLPLYRVPPGLLHGQGHESADKLEGQVPRWKQYQHLGPGEALSMHEIV